LTQAREREIKRGGRESRKEMERERGDLNEGGKGRGENDAVAYAPAFLLPCTSVCMFACV
jgi:hypothetical protein